jgi:DNA helicase-2/ATP-dependent DNA helicase PcrA
MKLNPAQQEAVEHEVGPLLVLAGAGSGKTRVIVGRIARLIERGVRPEQILGVTFTNKAAGEMAERLGPLVGEAVARRVVLSTFHSFGVRFLGEEWKALGTDGRFVIFDQGDSLGLVREILSEHVKAGAARKLDIGALLARISKWKNDFVSPDELRDASTAAARRAAKEGVEYDDVAREIYPRYEAALRAMHAVDFDDLVVAPVRILRDRPDLREKWQTRFRHMLVDEFQDTSRSQLELVRLLANPLRNVCVVGDDDQSIYAWRGADVGNILEFESHFPGAKVVKLEENYRSRTAVLEVANAAIARSRGKRHGKTLRAARGAGDRVRLVVTADPEQEAKFVAAEIKTLVDEERRRFRDIAVLYRGNLQARVIEEELRAAGVPYQLFGGTQFYDRKEIKDAAAYLRVIVNPRDDISLRRIVNYPARGIGESTVERVERYARAHGLAFSKAFEALPELGDVPDAARRGARALLDALGRARARFHAGGSLAEATRALFADVGLSEAIADVADGSAAGARRISNVDYLVESIARYEQSVREDKPSLAQFLTRITMRFESDEEQEGPPNRVVLSTLHASKGLEFPVVFLVGLVEGVLPHARTTDPKASDLEAADVDEERRLFYVGVTRAQDRLYLVRPRMRALRGKPTPLVPSRFLEGLPDEHVEVYDRAVARTLAPAEIEALGTALLDKLKAARAQTGR